MGEFEGHETALIADVDCIGDGKALCDANGVRGFPTIKYGNPASLEDYKGGRDLASLQKFAAENLKPTCSPQNFDLCDADEKAAIESLMAMGEEKIAAEIAKKESQQAEAEKEFKDAVAELQATYKLLQEQKDETMEAIKNSGLGMLKAVSAAMKSAIA